MPAVAVFYIIIAVFDINTIFTCTVFDIIIVTIAVFDIIIFTCTVCVQLVRAGRVVAEREPRVTSGDVRSPDLKEC